MDFLLHAQTFVRIADAGSISKAARSLRLSIAMASRHLSALEGELGTRLMRRTTRQLTLTEAGLVFLPQARALLRQAQEARESVHASQGVRGQLVVSLPVSFGSGAVSGILLELLEAHPQLQLDLRFEDRYVDMVAEGVDVAIRTGSEPPNGASFVARRLALIDRRLCAAPELLRQHGSPNSLAALEAMPCVVWGGQSTWLFETPEGPRSISVRGRLRTNSMASLRAAALSGAGVARLPLWWVDDDLRKKRLVHVLPQAHIHAIELYGVYHESARGSAGVRALLDCLAEELPRKTRMRAPDKGRPTPVASKRS
jgi:DNA-binding transcriptional LysR family regulator